LLEDVSLDFRRGELTVIIGTVGSGKSALLQALVEELPVSSGTITRRYNTLAYACQEPWVMDGTVKENITMGLALDEKWYTEVVNACGLKMDFQQLRDGDQTIVGDRGVQCSGGQRARIGLARSIYRDPDVLVADDPLSAVDSKVGRQLFHEAIQGLMINRGKCVILATHQHQYVNDSRCVLMVQGRVGCIGSYDDCVTASDGKLTAHAADDTVDSLTEDLRVAPIAVPGDNVEEEDNEDGVVKVGNAGEENKEVNTKGVVRNDTYVHYVKAMGGIWVGVLLFVLFSATQASVLITITTIGRWSKRPPDEQDDWDIVGLVLGLGGTVCVLGTFRAFITFRLTVNASRKLHDRMAKAVLRAKIEFFDTNALGVIINRFSSDVGSNDDMLPPTLFDFFMIAFIVLGAVITTVITLPFTLVAVPPLTWYFLSVRKVFVTSSRELKRLEGLARSPIFAMLGESLGGIATIRSNDSLGYFRQKFHSAHDGHTRAFFAFVAASRWVGFRM
jgi:ATP-binding cassette subfamily C (CFTR/MRP) protein 4